MLKKMSLRKLMISFSALFTLFLLYIIPDDNTLKLDNIKQEVINVNKDVVNSDIFLLDGYNMVALTGVSVNGEDTVSKARELINILISGGENEEKIPNGFKAILPSDTVINNISFDNGVIKIDFSSSILDVDVLIEQRMIESIVYTLTGIDGVDGVIIFVDGKILDFLPKSKINLPSTLDRSFGINKVYDITSVKDIMGVTVYYVNKYNDNTYYVPVTKYSNDDREKIMIVVDCLSGSSAYNTNLMSYLDGNTSLISVSLMDDVLSLNFNEHIFSDYDSRKILEEVVYTISLSVRDNYDVNSVIFNVNDEEIYKSDVKLLEKY